MDTFSVRDLREHTGALIHDAEQGKLSLVTKRGRPVFLALPFREELVELGLPLALAIHLYREQILSLGKAAKVAHLSLEEFIEKLGKLHIPVVNYAAKDLKDELEALDD